jgi:predicted TIM-barrel fold metal-dependent hydrolase
MINMSDDRNIAQIIYRHESYPMSQKAAIIVEFSETAIDLFGTDVFGSNY